jgi:diguanylate cyclase (GGDEF)-like protein
MRRLMLSLAVYGAAIAALAHMIAVGALLALLVPFLLCGAALAVTVYASGMAESKKESASRLKHYSAEKAALSAAIANEDMSLADLRAKEVMTADLYEITKKMSKDLTFDGIFAELGALLKDGFSFDNAELLILKETDGYIHVDKVYRFGAGMPAPEGAPEKDYGSMLTLFAKDKRGVFVENPRAPSFGALPLLSENKFVGIIAVEGMPRADFERLTIVATQFALEMKKVFLYETVETLAITDSLTGLYTRRYFTERISEELDRSRKRGFRFAFVMMDIDDFKACNDKYGHLVGDVVLKEISRMIRESVREIDLVARYGGEEFSLILPETDRKGAILAAERIRKRIAQHVFSAYDEKLNVTVSAGLAVYPEDASDIERLIGKADAALYRAKNSGKNIICDSKG